jgi:hypothetical protein
MMANSDADLLKVASLLPLRGKYHVLHAGEIQIVSELVTLRVSLPRRSLEDFLLFIDGLESVPFAQHPLTL